MLKIENTEVYGFEAAIRGMRNPMNSWEKSDSYHKGDAFVLGKNDLALMKSLVKAGSDHSKFMRMINVTMDITAPLYWWKEFDTYKVGTVRNSCSTMHKITDKMFTIDDFSHEHLKPRSIKHLQGTINELNLWRDIYINGYPAESGCTEISPKDKDSWWQVIQLLPSSYNQRATVQLNYAVLRNMYKSRKDHKLDEWHTFCEWVESLPYSEIITGGSENGED
ncbi:MAG: hypothetical protein ACI4JV_00195 [Ruminiclostridium sp.]